MEKLVAAGISVVYDGEKIIEDVSLTLNEGELVSLLGVSGSGKTTVFNVLSGLLKPDEGKVLIDGRDITGKPGDISYMLQKDMLLRHLTVIDNVSLPLVLKGMGKKEAREKARSYLPDFGLEGTENKYPKELSGGMRQRCALLRTYLTGADVALLDEPFSALDTLTKASVHRWYMDIMERIKLSTVFVTHDIDEAVLLSDRVYILSGKPGRITEEIKIDIPKPRDPLSDEFIRYKREIIAKIV
ncbi:MAG: ABC transporter ATP-binding protein [Clostridia bacterium]|nr:ABC transporter ATP-binding protein [Clostridia bacterium]